MKEQYRAKTCVGGTSVATYLNEQAEQGYKFLSATHGKAEGGEIIVIVEYHGDGEPSEVEKVQQKRSAAYIAETNVRNYKPR